MDENLNDLSNIFLIKYTFVWATFFIVYPNGAVIIAVPILIFILINLIKYKMNSNSLEDSIFSILLIILIAPTLDTTLMYLIRSELRVGFDQKMDFWGYYGAFILGKDNPIHDYAVILKIKELWHSGSSISEILLNIYHANITNKNYFFLLNILPSLFGLYHFFLHQTFYGILNYILVIILITLNYVLIKNIFNNLKIYI